MIQQERFESLKSGSIAAIAVAITFLLIATSHHFVALQPNSMVLLPDYGLTWNGAISSASAVLAGFLFGVTYRYIVRTDQNSHLKSGAVLAFGLVRGLAQVDVGLSLHATPTTLAVLSIESLLLFAIARLVLDWAIAQGLIKPFGLS